jgi:hypothetical protein
VWRPASPARKWNRQIARGAVGQCVWIFDGGHTMTATAAPAYLGNPANVRTRSHATIAFILNVRPPNGCEGRVLSEAMN